MKQRIHYGHVWSRRWNWILKKARGRNSRLALFYWELISRQNWEAVGIDQRTVTLKQAQLQFVLLPCSLDGVIEATSHTLFFFGINHSIIIRLVLLYSGSTYRFYARLNEAQTSRNNTGALIKEQTASIFMTDLWVYLKYGKKNYDYY